MIAGRVADAEGLVREPRLRLGVERAAEEDDARFEDLDATLGVDGVRRPLVPLSGGGGRLGARREGLEATALRVVRERRENLEEEARVGVEDGGEVFVEPLARDAIALERAARRTERLERCAAERGLDRARQRPPASGGVAHLGVADATPRGRVRGQGTPRLGRGR